MLFKSWKLKFVDAHVNRILKLNNKFYKRYIFIKSRRSTIHKSLVGRRVSVHTGRKYHNFKITNLMVGHKFGEYAYTKKLGHKIHSSARNKKRLAKMKIKRK